VKLRKYVLVRRWSFYALVCLAGLSTGLYIGTLALYSS